MRRKGTDAPKIDVLAQHYLQLGLRNHPAVAQHVPNISELENMPLLKLMRLAEEMGIEPNALIESTEQRENERTLYSMSYPAFRGELEFDLSISFGGEAFTRKAKIVYEHTPKWEYFDLRKQEPFKGRAGTGYHIEILAVPEEYDDDDQPMEGKPYWVRLDDLTHEDVVPHQLFHDLLEAIDGECKAEDTERRRLAAAKKTAIKPASRRKH